MPSAGTFYGKPAGIGPGTFYGGNPLGERGADVALAGPEGPSLLGLDVQLPAEAEDLFRVVVLTVPPGLTLFTVDKYSRVDAEGPAGTYVGSKQGYRFNVAYGTPQSFTIVIGSGSTVSGGGTLDGPSVSGGASSSPAGPSVVTGNVPLSDGSFTGSIQGGGPTRPIYPPGFYPRLRRTVRLTVPDPQEVPDLSPIAPGDTITVEFDFRPYDTATSPQVSVARVNGPDGLPGITPTGQAVVVEGSYVLQRFTADLTALGSSYELICSVTDTETGDHITATGRLPVCI